MASKAANAAETAEIREDAAEAPLLDTVAVAIKKMVARGKERGYVTYDELNAALPPEQVSSEQIEDTMTMLSELGVNVVESEESRRDPPKARPRTAKPKRAAIVDDDDIGRTDDPVRMYLREMGSVELLSREGEIAIAKRIEAGREMMIGGICESPLTIRALLGWRDALIEGKMLLRDIIDLDATYGNAVSTRPRRRWPKRPPRRGGGRGSEARSRASRRSRRERSRRRRRGRRRRGQLDLARRDGSAAEAAACSRSSTTIADALQEAPQASRTSASTALAKARRCRAPPSSATTSSRPRWSRR